MEGEVNKEADKLPPGFRFHPTDEELITSYLVNKISDSSFTGRAITDVDLNKCEPWDLPGMCSLPLYNDLFCFLFEQRPGYKYMFGRQPKSPC